MEGQQSFAEKLLNTAKSTALRDALLLIWMNPDESGLIQTVRDGFPAGIPYREAARRLAEQGYTNGKGKAYHPYHVYELLVQTIAERTYGIVGYDGKDPEARKRLERELGKMMRKRNR